MRGNDLEREMWKKKRVKEKNGTVSPVITFMQSERARKRGRNAHKNNTRWVWVRMLALNPRQAGRRSQVQG